MKWVPAWIKDIELALARRKLVAKKYPGFFSPEDVMDLPQPTTSYGLDQYISNPEYQWGSEANPDVQGDGIFDPDKYYS